MGNTWNNVIEKVMECHGILEAQKSTNSVLVVNVLPKTTVPCPQQGLNWDTTQSGGDLTNHEPTAPPYLCVGRNKNNFLHAACTWFVFQRSTEVLHYSWANALVPYQGSIWIWTKNRSICHWCLWTSNRWRQEAVGRLAQKSSGTCEYMQSQDCVLLLGFPLLLICPGFCFWYTGKWLSTVCYLAFNHSCAIIPSP